MNKQIIKDALEYNYKLGFKEGKFQRTKEVIELIEELSQIWQMKVIEEYDINTPRDLFIEDFVRELIQRLVDQQTKGEKER